MQMEEKTSRAAMLKKAVAEVIGNFAMVFAGCGAYLNPAVTSAFADEFIRCEPKKDRKHVKGCC